MLLNLTPHLVELCDSQNATVFGQNMLLMGLLLSELVTNLEVEEKALHGAMPPHRRKILEGKRILLLKEIILDMQYPDPEIADLIANGFDLIGTCGGGNVLPQDFQPATLTAQDLELHSESSNKAIIFSTKSSGDESVNQELWKKTQEEVEKGWLKKLYSLPQDGGRVSRRFAVVLIRQSQTHRQLLRVSGE